MYDYGKRMPRPLYIFLSMSFAAIFTWSAIQPAERITWVLEALPVVIGAIIVFTTYRQFPLTTLSYILLWIGATLIMVGAHYTYSEMPLFNYLRDSLVLGRNHYDRLGHIFQGVIAAIIFREVFIRTSPLKHGIWLFIVVISLSVTKSVLYEFAEWTAAVIMDQSAHEFLGTQGDEWDAQKDMALALLGTIIALTLFGRYHDEQLKKAGEL